MYSLSLVEMKGMIHRCTCMDEVEMSLACFEYAKTQDNLESRRKVMALCKVKEVTS
jgi:hypothetical protein